MFRKVIIFSIIITVAYCNVVIETTSLSVPRRLGSSVQVGNKAYFSGGFTFNDVGSDVVDIFDLDTNQWNGTLTLAQSRGFLTTVSNGTHIFFIGGHDFVNQPRLYNLTSRTVDVILNDKSGPTVRQITNLAIAGSTAIIFGNDAIDFMDLTTGTWSFSRDLWMAMRSLSLPRYVFNVDNYVFFGGRQQNSTDTTRSTLWRYDIGSTVLTRYDSLTFLYDFIDPSYNYNINNGVVVMHQSSRVWANRISSNQLFELTISNYVGTVSILNTTFVFNKLGYYLIDWSSENMTWIDYPHVYLTFSGPDYSVSFQSISALTSNICLYTTSNPQGTCAIFGLVVSSGIVGQVPLGSTKNLFWTVTNIYLYDQSTHSIITFTESFATIVRVIPHGNDFYLFENNGGVIRMHPYTQPVNNVFSYDNIVVTMLPDFIIGNDFISVSEAKVGVDLNALSPQSLLLIPSSLSAHSGDYFIMMPINPQKVFYNQIDVYNIEAELWENIIEPPFTFVTYRYVRAAVLGDQLVLWLQLDLASYNLTNGTWIYDKEMPYMVSGEESKK